MCSVHYCYQLACTYNIHSDPENVIFISSFDRFNMNFLYYFSFFKIFLTYLEITSQESILFTVQINK